VAQDAAAQVEWTPTNAVNSPVAEFNLLWQVSSGSPSAQARPREADYNIAAAGPAAIKSVAKEGQRVNDSTVAPSIRGMSGEGRVDVSATGRPSL